MQFQETEAAQYAVMMVLYVFKLGGAFKNDECRLLSGYILPINNQTLHKWHSRYGIEGFFWWIISTFEVIFDISTMLDLFLVLNFLEAGYFVGKMAINGVFYALSTFISFLYWYRKAKLEAEV